MNTPEKPVVASTELFDRCAETKLFRDGVIQIHCKLGLWSVQGRDARHTRREAMHYWIQYFEDGEYNDLLSNPSVLLPPLGGGKEQRVVGHSESKGGEH